MISGRMDWNDDALGQIKALAFERIARVTVEYHTLVLEELNISNPRPYKTPSRPGEPPRKRTGWLQRHVVYQLDEKALTGRVGPSVNAIYGVFLDLGTRWMAARPWLLATAKKYWSRLQKITRE